MSFAISLGSLYKGLLRLSPLRLILLPSTITSRTTMCSPLPWGPSFLMLSGLWLPGSSTWTREMFESFSLPVLPYRSIIMLLSCCDMAVLLLCSSCAMLVRLFSLSSFLTGLVLPGLSGPRMFLLMGRP